MKAPEEINKVQQMSQDSNGRHIIQANYITNYILQALIHIHSIQLTPGQNGSNFSDATIKYLFFKSIIFIYIFVEMEYVSQGPIDSNSVVVSFQFEPFDKIIIDVMHKINTTDFI